MTYHNTNTELNPAQQFYVNNASLFPGYMVEQVPAGVHLIEDDGRMVIDFGGVIIDAMHQTITQVGEHDRVRALVQGIRSGEDVEAHAAAAWQVLDDGVIARDLIVLVSPITSSSAALLRRPAEAAAAPEHEGIL